MAHIGRKNLVQNPVSHYCAAIMFLYIWATCSHLHNAPDFNLCHVLKIIVYILLQVLHCSFPNMKTSNSSGLNVESSYCGLEMSMSCFGHPERKAGLFVKMLIDEPHAN